MKYVRLYTTPDGESHFEDVESPIEVGSMQDWQKGMVPVQDGFFVLRSKPGFFADWHPAPRRQLIVMLAGEVEYGASDGTSRRHRAGEAFIVDDLTGKGHTTRILGDEDRYSIFIPLPDGVLA